MASEEQPAVQVRDLHKSFGSVEVLKGISFDVKQGEVAVIIGPSGSGKSTLLRCLNLLETPTSGQVFTLGTEVTSPKVDLPKVRRDIGMVFQHFELFPHRTALDNVAEGPRYVLRRSRGESRARARELLEKVGLAHRADQYPSQLSGGEKQRVAIARALALDPKIMLFDEPTSALDPELKGEVLDTMLKLAVEGMTMVVVTHEMAFARRVASHAIFVDEGVVMEEGSPQEILTHPSTERLDRFLNLIYWGDAGPVVT